MSSKRLFQIAETPGERQDDLRVTYRRRADCPVVGEPALDSAPRTADNPHDRERGRMR